MGFRRNKELTKGRIFILKRYIAIKVFLRQVNYILVFFIGLLLFSLFSLLLFRYNETSHTYTQEIPKLEVFHFTLNRFDMQHVDMFIKADKGMQYKDKEIYINFFGSRLNEDLSAETLEGQEVWHIGDVYNFLTGIYYTKSPNIKFFSEKGIYNTKNEVFQGKGRFFIEDTNMTTNGEDIFYDKTTDTITAKNITTKLIKF